MQPIISLYSQIQPQQFLTLSEERLYNQLDKNLKNKLYKCFDNYLSQESLKTIRLVLKVIASSTSDHYKIFIEKVILTLFEQLKFEEANDCLIKLIEIYNGEGEATLYNCLYESVNKVEILKEAISLLCDLTKTAELSLVTLKHIPLYEEGGKEYLEKLVKGSFEDTLEKCDSVNTELMSTDFSKVLADLSKKHFVLFEEAYSYSIQYLSCFQDDQRLSLNHYSQFFKELKNNNELSESIKILMVKVVIFTTASENNKIRHPCQLKDLQDFIKFVANVGEEYGEEAVEALVNASFTSLDELVNACKLVCILSKSWEVLEIVSLKLDQLRMQVINIKQFICFLEPLNLDVNLLNSDNLSLILNRFKKDSTVCIPLEDSIIQKTGEYYQIVKNFCKQWMHLEIEELVKLTNQVLLDTPLDNLVDKNLKLAAIGILSIRLTFKIELNITQILTVLALLDPEKAGCIAQVRTGEGKTFIVLLLAFILAQDKSIHIISSSRSLAIRDRNIASRFFKNFNITTSHICKSGLRKDSFKAQVIYGTAADFEFALMQEIYYAKKLFNSTRELNNKRFDHVIIDEVDNLTIDTAEHAAYLGIEADADYRWIYYPIFNFVKANFVKGDLSLLHNEDVILRLRKELQLYADGRFYDLTKGLEDKQLTNWLVSAYQVLYEKQENEDYIVVDEPVYEKDLSEVRSSHNSFEKVVKIVDAKNTGKVQESMRWSDGIHQFVEIKHQLIPKEDSATAIAMSHVSLYKMYKNICGLTGTMGSDIERQAIKEIYGLDSFDVPSHKPLKRIDEPLNIALTETEKLEQILEKVNSCRRQGRPILIICESIKESLAVQNKLIEKQIPHEILNEIQKKEEEEILNLAGASSAVTIATNVAGRGADIKINEEINQKGGLHVLITFYPDTQRIEDQARGRAGRQGQNGSSEILVAYDSLELPFKPIKDGKFQQQVRQYLETQRKIKISSLKQRQVIQAQIDDYCFSVLKKFYSRLNAFQSSFKNHDFIKKHASMLANRRIISNYSCDMEKLHPKDKKIVKEILSLLKGEQKHGQQHWENLLEQLGNHIKDKIVKDWVATSYRQILEVIKVIKFYPPTIDLEDLEDIKAKIETLCEEKLQNWDRYLNPQGPFLISYIEDLIGIKLSEIL